MYQDSLLILAASGIFSLLLLYLVISIATKADKRAKYEWGQLQLLAKIAKAQGVPAEEIQEIFKVVDKR